MLCDPNALRSLSLGLTNILFASRHLDSERRPPEIGIYCADRSIWPRMLLNSFSSAARASINSGELSWLATELVRDLREFRGIYVRGLQRMAATGIAFHSSRWGDGLDNG
jgi:hypothetical protein